MSNNASSLVTFENTNVNWTPQVEYNLLFLRSTQNHMNDKLARQEHLFLNEVYDALGVKRTSEGALTGWLKGDHVDFGIFGNEQKLMRIANGEPITIELNVTGIIYDKI